MCPDSLVLGVRGFCALAAFGGSGVCGDSEVFSPILGGVDPVGVTGSEFDRFLVSSDKFCSELKNKKHNNKERERMRDVMTRINGHEV